jgi:magnesium-transporting ATPase (P-type)
MTTALSLPEKPDTIRVYVKGAPEYLINMCTKTIATNGKTENL